MIYSNLRNDYELGASIVMPFDPKQGISHKTNPRYTMKYDLVPLNTSALFRIRALKDIEGTSVKAGDLGGFVSDGNNLSQEGSCWIYDQASATGGSRVLHHASMHNESRLCESARLYGSAKLLDSAIVGGWSSVCGHATISEEAVVRGSSLVSGRSKVSGLALIHGATIEVNAVVLGGFIPPNCVVGDWAMITRTEDVFTASPVGSQSGVLTVYKTAVGLSATRGCFSGTTEKFLSESADKHDEDTAREYRLLIEVATSRILKTYPEDVY